MKSTIVVILFIGAAFAILTGGCSKQPPDTESLLNAQRKIAELETELARVKSAVQQQTQQPPPSVLGDYIATGYGVIGGKLAISKQANSFQIAGTWELQERGGGYASQGSISQQELRFIDSAFDKAKLQGQFFWQGYPTGSRNAIREQAANLVVEKDVVKVVSPSVPEAVMIFKKTW